MTLSLAACERRLRPEDPRNLRGAVLTGQAPYHEPKLTPNDMKVTDKSQFGEQKNLRNKSDSRRTFLRGIGESRVDIL
jgi:hypothetical protein